ncbi:Asp23/Gls24 family envelope stress response protein [Rhodococcus sovatensis]|uniref:Asp23/Gls24 family envelope stress response protein n=1 Tax=Rhodococcus sovatensis TaxID=1805840 RepID=A0ABZ2PDC9_9NOCA
MTDVDTGGPGTLVIKERVISRVAVAAALTVPDVVRQVGGMSRLTGRDLPRADVSVGEHSASVNLYIAVQWPSRISDVAHAVHDEVARALDEIVGLPLHRLNVVVAGTSPRSDAQSPISENTHPVLRPRPPTASPAAHYAAVVLAVALLGVAFVAGREFLIVHGTIVGAPWIANTVEWIADLHWATWMIAGAAGLISVGSILVGMGLTPRSKTHTGVRSPSSPSPMVWLRPTDVARMCSDHAGNVPGSESVRTTVTKKKVTVEVRRVASGDDAILTESVRDAVAPVLAVLADTRKVRVRLLHPSGVGETRS